MRLPLHLNPSVHIPYELEPSLSKTRNLTLIEHYCLTCKLYSNFTNYPNNVLSYPGFHWESHAAVTPQASSSLLIWSSSLIFLSSSWPWYFSKIQAIWICFFLIRIRLYIFGRNVIEVILCPFQCILSRGTQCHFVPFDVNFDHLVKVVFSLL